MNNIFISYKSEDEARVSPIVEGLRNAGLSVWWDRDIAVGKNWRQSITEQLGAASCVIVVWSDISINSQGEFVHDEAWRAYARGVLIPVWIDHISEPPLGFGEIESINLANWRGNPNDLCFQNLIATTKAVADGLPRPHPLTLGHRARLVATWVSTLSMAATALALGANLAGVQKPLCKVPGLHAVCVSWGLGGVPAKAEEALWAARKPGDCASLQGYLERFPNGAFAEEAARRLQIAEITEEERWNPEEQRLPLTVRATLDPLISEKAARDDARVRGATEARQTCEGFEAGEFRLVSTAIEAQNWRCWAWGSGFVCGFDGQAICRVEARQVTQRKVCK